jgi:hypothetical protein
MRQLSQFVTNRAIQCRKYSLDYSHSWVEGKVRMKTFFMSDDHIREMELDPETPAVDKKEVKIYF